MSNEKIDLSKNEYVVEIRTHGTDEELRKFRKLLHKALKEIMNDITKDRNTKKSTTD